MRLADFGFSVCVHTAHAPGGNRTHGGVAAVRDLVAQDVVGVVYTVPRGRDRGAAATACVKETLRRAPDAAVLVDADLYSGKKRKLGSSGLDEAWIRRQHRDGLAFALTDSGYVPPGDERSLRTILAQAEALANELPPEKGVIAALPIAVDWLVADRSRFVDTIADHAVPVALMVEHAKDPMELRGAVTGLAAVLASSRPVCVLRSDAAVLGAIAYGAALVAVGDSSSLRHIYPVRNGPPPPSSPGTSIFVPALLGFYRLEQLENAMSQLPRHPAWSCPCRVCDGRDLAWITSSAQPEADAFAHAVSAIARTARLTYGELLDGSAMQAAWYATLQSAEQTYLSIVTSRGQILRISPALRRWKELYESAPPRTLQL